MKGEKNHFFGKNHTEENKELNRQVNLGKKCSKETIEKRRLKMLGHKVSKETRQKISDANKGKNNGMYGKQNKWGHHTETTKQILKEQRKTKILPVKDTTIEIKLQDFLKELNIEFETHKYMKIEHGYQCDIFVSSLNLVIEADGDYWHNYPHGKELDHIRTKELKEAGYQVLRLCECDIRKIDVDKFEEKLKCV